MARLLDKYKTDVVPQLMKDYNYSSIMEVPKIEKVVILSLIHI